MTDQALTHTNNSAALDVSLDTDVKLNLIEKLPNLAKDETIRGSLVAFDDKGSPALKLSSYYFIQVGEDYVNFATPKLKPTTLAQVAKVHGEPKIRFGTILLKYETDKKGTIKKDADGNIGYTFYVWLLDVNKWNQLKDIHREWNLVGRDLTIKLDGKSDVKFQSMNINPAQDCVWKNLPNADEIAIQGKSLYDSSVIKFLAKDMPDDDVLIKLGLETAPETPNGVNPFKKGTPQQQITEQAGIESASPFSKLKNPQ